MIAHMVNLDISVPRIWDNDLSERENIHRSVLFRQHFQVEALLNNAELLIAADTDFIVCLDGMEIDRGNFLMTPRSRLSIV